MVRAATMVYGKSRNHWRVLLRIRPVDCSAAATASPHHDDRDDHSAGSFCGESHRAAIPDLYELALAHLRSCAAQPDAGRLAYGLHARADLHHGCGRPGTTSA